MLLLGTCVVLFITLLTAITLFGYRRYARPARVFEQVGGGGGYGMPVLDRVDPNETGLAVNVLHQIGAKIPVNPNQASAIRRDLMAAGYRSERALYIYLAIRVIACVTLVVLAFLFRGQITSNPVLEIVIPVGAGFLGYMGSSFLLDHLVSRRHEFLRSGLPDALDLMVIAVEAGIGLDEAILHVSRELKTSHPVISDEFAMVNLEILAGKRRGEALHNLGERTREPELRKLVAILIQTDRFGTSIADSLRVHSEFMRTKRRQVAEERAGKVGVKLVFPIFFLILPSIMVIAAGPGLLQVFKYLFPMMRNFGQF
jgi:tight adherence protein C